MRRTSLPPLRSPFAPPGPHPAPQDAARAAGSPPGQTHGIRILTVCTGNICRSAYAHHVLQARLDAELGPGVAHVESAGTAANQALAVPQEILALVPDVGVRAALAAHRPRQLTARVLAGQDLVLTATDRHLDVVVRESPAALRRSATLLDAGALLADASVVAPGGGPAGIVAAWGRGRTTTGGRSRRAADLPDPFRGPAEGYAAMARALDPALASISTAIVRAMRPGGGALSPSGGPPGRGPFPERAP